MKPLFFLIVFTFFVCKESNAQNQNDKSPTVIYFKIGKGLHWTKHQLDSFLLLRTTKSFKLIPKIEGVEQKGDTLFYKINFAGDYAPSDKNNNRLSGELLPDFNLKDIKGNIIRLKDIKGKPIVINFWFASCLPCIAEMTTLNELKEKYNNSDVVFLSMTFETKSTVLRFLKQHQFNFTPISDAKDYCEMMTQLYPLTLFVDKQGIIKSAEHLMPPLFNYETTKRIDELDPGEFEKNIDAIE